MGLEAVGSRLESTTGSMAFGGESPTHTNPDGSHHTHTAHTQLFVLSVLLSCTMRCLSFVAIGSLNVQSIALHEGADAPPTPSMDAGTEDPDTQFYEKVGLGLLWHVKSA